ncbi:DUF6261 family protein [Marinifilum sp. RC60d5]|uniref:DUF6261 family protein n=1 Tax=Marinifilum sp. RC60d5 TaxID=3458414 RepID=UPI0040371A0D
MEVKILSKCAADETAHLGSTALSTLDEMDLSTDNYLSDLKSKLNTENSALSESLRVERKHEFTNELAELDEIFDDRVVCLKKFIEANTYSSDPVIAKNAEKALDKLAGYDLSFYKLGYEKELPRAFSLLQEFEEPDMKTVVESLVGVVQPLAELKTSANNLNQLYKQNQDVLALKKDVIPSTLQKKVVVDIFNDDLLPYLKTMAKVKPAEYAVIFTKIARYIDTVNTKIRARRNRTAAEAEANSEEE